MAGMSFGQGMQARLGLAQDKRDQAWFDSQTQRMAVLGRGNDGQQSGQQPAKPQGLAAAKTPTFSNLGSMTGSQLGGNAGGLGLSGAGNRAALDRMQTGLSPAEKYSANPFDPVGNGAYPDFSPPGSKGKTLYAENAAGKVFTGVSPQYQTDLAPVEPRMPVLDQTQQQLGLRKGITKVKDKKGRGNPKKDTVNAKLAEGEAVLNAAAAEMLGRDKIAALNAEGAKKMGLRAGATVKKGAVHAVRGVTGIELPDDDPYTEKTLRAQARRANPTPRMSAAEVSARMGTQAEQAEANARAAAAIEREQSMAPRKTGSYDARAGLRTGAGSDPVMEDAMRQSSNMAANDRIAAENARLAASKAPPAAKVAPEVPKNTWGINEAALRDADKFRPRSNMEQYLDSTAKLRNAGTKFTQGAGRFATKVATSPATAAALAPVWAMTGGREEAEATSGIDTNDWYGSTRGAFMGAGNKAAKQAEAGDYGRALAEVGLGAFNTMAGFADDSLVKPMAQIGQFMTSGRFTRPAEKQAPAAAMTAGDAKLLGRETDAAVNGAQVPVPAGYIAPSPERDAAEAGSKAGLSDEAGYSQYFNERGITDEMRRGAQKGYGGVDPSKDRTPGLRDVSAWSEDPQGLRNKIYRSVDKNGHVTYVGMGAPSRIAAEKARAEDPAVQKAAQLKRLEELAMRGNAEAGETLRQIIQADAQVAAARVTADAKSSKDGEKEGWFSKMMKDHKVFAKPAINKDGVQTGTYQDEVAAGEFQAFAQQRLAEAAAAGENLDGGSATEKEATFAKLHKQFIERQAINAAAQKRGGAKASPLSGAIKSVGPKQDIELGDAFGRPELNWWQAFGQDGRMVTDSTGGKRLVADGDLEESGLPDDILRRYYGK